MSCSISTTATSAGSAATVAKMSPLTGRHPGRGAVQQSTRGFRATARQLQQAPLAIGQLARRALGQLGEAELLQQVSTSRATCLDCPSGRQRCARPRRFDTASASACVGVSEAKSWLIWKVRTRPAQRARWATGAVMSRPPAPALPLVGAEHAGELIDQRRLARAIGADQGRRGARRPGR